MQAVEKRLAPPDATWPKLAAAGATGGPPPWTQSGASRDDDDEHSQFAKLGERKTFRRFSSSDERNTELHT